MTEVDVDSRPETFSQPINVSGMDEVSQHEGKKAVSQKSVEFMLNNKVSMVNGEDFFLQCSYPPCYRVKGEG